MTVKHTLFVLAEMFHHLVCSWMCFASFYKTLLVIQLDMFVIFGHFGVSCGILSSLGLNNARPHNTSLERWTHCCVCERINCNVIKENVSLDNK